MDIRRGASRKAHFFSTELKRRGMRNARTKGKFENKNWFKEKRVGVRNAVKREGRKKSL